jgi:CheY-like chemotaxis protein
MTETRPILVIEDSEEDFAALSWVWRRSAIAVPLVRCKDGEDALEWLSGTGRYLGRKDTGNPALILLDLNLPRTKGATLLLAMKTSPVLQITPVLILTTSANPADIEESYRNGANAYLTKPFALEDLELNVRKLIAFWMNVASLPHGESDAGR